MMPADYFTLARIPLAIIGAGLILTGQFTAGLAVIIAAGLLDALDGNIARMTKPTERGAKLDVIADKIFIILTAIAILIAGQLKVYETLLFFTREILCIPLLFKKRKYKPLIFGKVTTALQFITLALIILYKPIAAYLIWTIAFAGIIAAGQYHYYYWRK